MPQVRLEFREVTSVHESSLPETGRRMSAPSRQVRGNSYDRRRRREWIIEQFAERDSRGRLWIRCEHCKKRMWARSRKWQVDRFPVCGHAGGRYVRWNVVPSCSQCNKGRCAYCRLAPTVPFPALVPQALPALRATIRRTSPIAEALDIVRSLLEHLRAQTQSQTHASWVRP